MLKYSCSMAMCRSLGYKLKWPRSPNEPPNASLRMGRTWSCLFNFLKEVIHILRLADCLFTSLHQNAGQVLAL